MNYLFPRSLQSWAWVFAAVFTVAGLALMYGVYGLLRTADSRLPLFGTLLLAGGILLFVAGSIGSIRMLLSTRADLLLLQSQVRGEGAKQSSMVLSETAVLMELLAELFEEQKSQQCQVNELVEKLAERSAEMEQFVYAVSHDLKSPVVTCSGFSRMLREDIARQDWAGVHDSCEHIENACLRMSDNIEGLLEFARIGQRQTTFQVINLEELLTQLLQRLSPLTFEQQADLQIETSLPTVLGDRSAIQRVFENLISNALKYGSGPDGVRIRIGSRSSDESVLLYVRDEGPGIPEEYQAKIFGLFERLSAEHKGSGIGLATVSKIMSLHNGRVWVESRPGDGAAFVLAFPKLLSDAVEMLGHA